MAGERELSQLHEMALAAVSQGVLICDENSSILYANAAFENITGYRAAEALGRNCRFLQGADTDPDVRTELSAAVHGGRLFEGEILNYRKDGTAFWNELLITPVRDKEGRLIRFIGIQRDVTARKQAETALRESEERFRLFMAHSPAAGWITDGEGRFRYLSPGYYRLFGVKGDLTGKCISDIYEPALAEVYQANNRRVLDERRIVETVEPGIRSDFSQGDFLVVKFPIEVPGGEPLLGGIALDITGQRLAQEAVRMQAHMLDHIGQAVIATDTQGRILYANRFAGHLYGWTPEEMLGRDVLDVTVPQTSREQAEEIMASLQRGENWSGEFSVQGRNGRVFPVLVTDSPLFDAEGKMVGIIGVSSDISARKEAEELLQKSENEQRELADQLETERTSLVVAQSVAKVGSWETDLSTMAVTWSAETYRIFEVTPDQFQPTHQGFLQMVHPQDRAAVDEAFIQSLEQRRSCEIEHRLLLPDGRLKFVAERWQVFRDDLGKAVRALGTCQDISESKRAERALRESEGRFTAFMLNAPMAAWIVSEEARVIYSNHGFARLFDKTPGEVTGKHLLELFGADFTAQYVENNQRVLASGHPLETMETAPRLDGSLGRYLAIKFPIPVPDGPRLIGGTAIDITEREVAREELHESEERFRQTSGQLAKVLDSSLDVICTFDAEGRFTQVNAACAKVWGYRAEELLGTPYIEKVLLEDQAKTHEAAVEIMAGKSTTSFENRYVRKDGSIAHITWSAWWSETDQSMFCVARDVTEHWRAHRALQMLSACNEALVRIEGEGDLLSAICRIAVEIGGYRMAWVGYVRDDEMRRIEPMAHAGAEDGYLAEITLSWNEAAPNGRGPAARSIRGGQVVVCEDVAEDEGFYMLDSALRRNYRGVICLPLRVGERNIGQLGLYSSEVRAVAAEEIKLLQELAADLAFGIGTIRSRLEARLMQEAVAEHAALLDNARDAIVVRDLDQRITYWNKSAELLYGWAEEEVIGRRAVEVTYKETSGYQQAYDALMQNGEWTGELHQVTRDGRELIVDSRWTLVRDAAGRPKSTLVINTDVTERKKALEIQMLTATRMELAAKASKVGIWEWDVESSILHWDEQMYALYGVTPGSVDTGFELWRRHLHPEDAERATAEIAGALQPDGRPFDTAFRIVVPPGNVTRHIRAQALVIRDPAGQAVRMLGTNWDVTEQVEREETLRKNLENERTLRLQALAGEKAKSEFLAVMSHEIRTPMNGVLGFADMLLHSPNLSPQDRELSQTIVSSGEAMLRILDDILDFSRIEAGRLAIEKQIFSPKELIEGIRALFTRQIQDKGLGFTVMLDDGLPDGLEGDAGRIRQILVNLIGNAQKFTEHGSIQVSARATPQAGEPGFLEFVVRDTGPGIAADRAQAVFEAFTQEDSSISRRHGGTGLGLTISRRLAELMGGNLHMNSQAGQGTVFTLLIPLVPATTGVNVPSAHTGPASPMDADFARRHPLRILVVEDDKVNLKLTVSILHKLGYEPLTACNGLEAVAIYERENPDCILMDVQMPEMDGMEATRKIRELESSRGLRPVFISALTANILPEDQQRCFDAGMNAYLNKPVKSQSIADVLAEAFISRS